MHTHKQPKMRWLSMVLLLIFCFKFGWNQLKNIVIKWIFLITAKHTHLFIFNIIPFVHHSLFLSHFLFLSSLSGLWILFDHQNPIFDPYNLVKANQIIHSNTHKMFMFCRFFCFIYLDDSTPKHTRLLWETHTAYVYTSVWQYLWDRYRCGKSKMKTENHIKIK